MLASILRFKKSNGTANAPAALSDGRLADMENLCRILCETYSEMSRHMEGQITARDRVTASLKEFITGVNSVAPYFEEISSISGRIMSVVESGVAAAGDIRDQAGEIRDSNQKAFIMVENVKRLCREIAAINQENAVVASRTGHLALKAAIEAAQAGNLGSGFTVVAKEMRTLAEKAQRTVKDIGGLLDKINNETGTISGAISQEKAVIEDSIVIVEKITGFFHGTEHSVRDITGEINEVASRVENVNSETGVLAGARQGVEKKRGSIQSAMVRIKECSEDLQSFLQCPKAENLSISRFNAANDISGAIQEIQSDMDQQVRSRERVSSILNGIFSEIESLENKVGALAGNSRKIQIDIGSGREEINLIQERMNRIKDLSDQSINRIDVLSGCSRQIGDFARLISGIASQTNLLALNAAVESARGGKEGLGFVVIAEEVRKLSSRAAAAVKEMESLALQVLEEIPEMILSLNEDTVKVKNGLAMAERLELCFSEIGGSAESLVRGLESVSEQVKAVAGMMFELADARASREEKRVKFVALVDKLNAEISCHL